MDEIKKRFEKVQDMGVSVRDMLMEMIGTCLFVLVGLLIAVYSIQDTPLSDPNVNGFVVAFTFGMAITAMAYMTSNTSGGQLNPAITVGCMAAGVISPVQAAANIFAQSVGTVLSASLLRCLVPEDVFNAGDMAVNEVPAGSSVGRAFLAETIGMFMIVLTVLECVAHPKSKTANCAPIGIGLCFVVCILAFGPVSSGSFNPARSFGPALVSGHFKDLWIYIVAPVLGGILAAPVHLLSVSGWDPKATQPKKGDADPEYVKTPVVVVKDGPSSPRIAPPALESKAAPIPASK